MGDASIADAAPDGAARPRLLWPRLLLLVLWTAATLWLASQHVMWRDEVRALGIALQGDSVIDMLRGMQGEGHPAVWYLLLRLGHALTGMKEVLPAVAWLAAAGAMTILALRAPFRLWTLALIMFGGFGLYEYAVSARNYGISMLVLFAMAALYSRYRDRGLYIGLLLALLCNTNVHAAFLAAGLLGFWLVEITSEEGLRWTAKHRQWLFNLLIAAAGAALCFIANYPPAHDAAVRPHSAGFGLSLVLETLSNPSTSFGELMPPLLGSHAAESALLNLLIFGALLGLAHRPAALLAGLAVLFATELFTQFVYPGDYRHKALLLLFLITLYWLVAEGRGGRWPSSAARGLEPIARAGGLAFVTLLALQLPLSYTLVRLELAGFPQSRARDLAGLLHERGLGDAILIANADWLLEPVPYYAANPLYFVREARFGEAVRFTRHARIHITLAELLTEAEALQRRHHRPVVILMQHRLEPGEGKPVHREFFGGSFTMPADQVDLFLSRTDRLARFAPAISDESYDVYLLRDG